MVSGDVELVGLALDRSATPDLEWFALEYGQGRTEEDVTGWVQIGDVQVSPVTNDVLVVWKTEGLEDGAYVLRISARDELGHSSDHTVAVTLVSALEEIQKETGGRVASLERRVELRVPPNGLARGGDVQLVFLPQDSLPPPPVEATATGIAYAVRPEGLEFRKRCTLTIGYRAAGVITEADLGVFSLTEGDWHRLGGTVNAAADEISVGIGNAGTFALFEAQSVGGNPGVSDLACQPRIISPGEGLYPSTTDISFVLGKSGDVDIRIYSISGNLVREIEKDRPLNVGYNIVQWNGKDTNGRQVADGLYIVVIAAGGKSANKTVAVLTR